jgi:hypothetical protein
MLQEQTADDQGTMFYATKSFGESGRLGARIVLHASQRAISGRELFIDHGSVRVTVSGALSTGVAGQRVIVAERDLRGSSWNSRMLTTGAGGRFSARWLLHGSSIFVAQWIGEPGQTGAGSRPLRITAPLR